VFTYASQTTLCAIAYIRNVRNDGNSVRFFASQTKICPIAPRSIPEPELSACVTGAQLAERCCNALDMNISDVQFFTDSIDAIWWIRGSKATEFKPFVKNRIHRIQNITFAHRWFHVPGLSNPADIGTRPLHDHLSSNSMWFKGPKWLSLEKSEWPTSAQLLPMLDHELPEQRKSTKVRSHVTSTESSDVNSVYQSLIDNKSRMQSAVNVLSGVRRFVSNCKSGGQNPVLDRELRAREYIDSENELLQYAQHQAYAKEIEIIRKNKPVPAHSELSKYQLFIDERGLLRVGGDARSPIILNKIKDYRHYSSSICTGKITTEVDQPNSWH